MAPTLSPLAASRSPAGATSWPRERSIARAAARADATMFNQLGLIGCGLMGGSFALALKRAGLVKRVVGYSKSPSTTERAKKLGVIDVAAESALLAVSGSDIVLLAVPVAATEATLQGDPPSGRAGRAVHGRRQRPSATSSMPRGAC